MQLTSPSVCLHHPNHTQLGLWGRENGSLFEDQKGFMEESGFKRSIGALELISMGA